MTLTTVEALRACELLVALAVGLQSLEMLALKASWAENGVWRWGTLAREHRPGVARLLGTVLAGPRFTFLVQSRLVLALLLVGWPASAPVALALLVAGSLLTATRFRGTFNGGSDMMTLVVLGSLLVARSAGTPKVQTAALAYIAIQVALSYFVAGVGKLRRPGWRNGTALRAHLERSSYSVPAAMAHMAPTRARGLRLAAWSVMAFELSFPLVFLGGAFTWIYLGVAVVFHLSIFFVFGLNRFLFAWLAAYPAVLCCTAP